VSDTDSELDPARARPVLYFVQFADKTTLVRLWPCPRSVANILGVADGLACLSRPGRGRQPGHHGRHAHDQDRVQRPWHRLLCVRPTQPSLHPTTALRIEATDTPRRFGNPLLQLVPLLLLSSELGAPALPHRQVDGGQRPRLGRRPLCPCRLQELRRLARLQAHPRSVRGYILLETSAVVPPLCVSPADARRRAVQDPSLRASSPSHRPSIDRTRPPVA